MQKIKQTVIIKCFVKLLATKGVDINIVNKNGLSVLNLCVSNGKVEYIKYLVNHKDELDFKVESILTTKVTKTNEKGKRKIDLCHC